MPHSQLRAVALACALSLLLAPASRAQEIVDDPPNKAANLRHAARARGLGHNPLRSLQNEALSLVNEARNLAQLPYTSLQTIQGNLGRIGGLMRDARRIAYDVGAIEQEFSRNYSLDPGATDASLLASARARWLNSTAAFRHMLDVQAGVVAGMPAARSETETLVKASQAASGIVQATQAGNQLLALQSQQLTDLAALMAAEGRAEALDRAGRAASREEAQERFRRFIDRADGYQPQAVDLFH
jgi:P-type conjugative transfer protein TrbJ